MIQGRPREKCLLFDEDDCETHSTNHTEISKRIIRFLHQIRILQYDKKNTKEYKIIQNNSHTRTRIDTHRHAQTFYFIYILFSIGHYKNEK